MIVMKTAIALRHLDFEDAGTFAPVLAESGYQLQYLDPTLGEMDHAAIQRADLLMVLGGPIGVDDGQRYPFLEQELSIVRERLDSGNPLLGICLGAQLMARAMGARVAPMGRKEIGFSPLTLTAAGNHSVLAALGDTPVLHWHGDQFEIPANTVHLASTLACPHQAFSIGRNVLGLQCHLEADIRNIEHWLVGHGNELAHAGIDPRTLRAEAAASGKRLARAARAVFAAWLNQLEHKAPPC